MKCLAIPETIWSSLIEELNDPRETSGFLLTGVADSDEDLTLFARQLQWTPEVAYVERTAIRLSVSSDGFVPALGAAAADTAIAVFVHTHPGKPPNPSTRDDRVDLELRVPALIRTGQSYYASLILGGTSAEPFFSGRVYDENGLVGAIDRVRIIGRRLRVLNAYDARLGSDAEIAAAFDRHVRAFGADGQQILSRLRIGVVGVGGTGSAIVEQLARLGVQELTVIDNETVTDTNLTRIHESSQADIGERKITVAARAVRKIGLGTRVRAIEGRVTDARVAKELRHLDLVFACTDDQAGRAVLSRLAVWYLIPTVDMGFVIDADDQGRVNGLYGRVTLLQPGAACLLCRQHINPQGIAADALPEEERRRRAAEGYVHGLDDSDPSVGAYTTLVAMFAINMVLERLFGYSPTAGGSTELILRLHDLAISRNTRLGNSDHFCGGLGFAGRGDAQPFLGMTW